MLKNNWKTYLVLLITSLLTIIQSIAQNNVQKPNIILIMTDDQGYGDVGFTGNPDIKTPVLDNLSEKSVNFDQFYVSPVCAPTRASLLTGKFFARTGVYDTYNGGAMMATEEITIAEILKDHGYKTGIFGKWHMGDNYPMRPQDQGFNESLVHLAGGIGQPGDYLNYFKFDSSYFDPVLMKNGIPTQTKGYCSDVYTDYLIEFIENNNDQPFFAYLAFNAPHTPLQLPQKYYDMYADLDIDWSDYPDKERDYPELTERDIETAKKIYGMVTNIDDNIGRVLEILKSNDLDQNTLVIFLTDNGPRGERYNGGLRNEKSSAYEGGVRVPCIMYLPDRFDPKIKVEEPVANIDLLPTLLDLINVDPPYDIDGKSILPLIEGRSVEWINDRPLFTHWHRGYPEPYRNIAVRKGDFKLVGNTDHLAPVNEMELYNIKNDPFELNNMVNQQSEKATELKQVFDDWYNKIIVNEHYVNPPGIVVGSHYENPVVLNRNDAKGAPGVWKQDHVYTFWDLKIKEDDMYDVKINFLNELPAPGRYVLKIGTIQRTIENKEEGNKTLTIEKMPLKKGNCRLESWYLGGDDPYITPFTVEIKRRL